MVCLEPRYGAASELAHDLLSRKDAGEDGKKKRRGGKKAALPTAAPPVVTTPPPAQPVAPSEPGNISIAHELVAKQPFPTRLRNILAEHGITNLEELSVMPDRQLMTMEGMGRLSLQKIRTAVLAARKRAQDEGPAESLLDLPLERLPMKGWTFNRLKRDAGINTVGELVARSPRDLLRVHALGRKTLKEIQRVVRSLGLQLKE